MVPALQQDLGAAQAQGLVDLPAISSRVMT